MAYTVHPEGFASQEIVVEPTSFIRGPRLLVDGQPAPKGKHRGEMLLTRDDGRPVVATWKAQALGFDVPTLVVDGKAIQIVEPLPWYAWACCAPSPSFSSLRAGAWARSWD